MEIDIAGAIKDFGFPVIAAFGMGYFIFFIWKWVTEEVDPVVEESHMTLIGLIDRVRMLDNDLIRMQTKLDMLLKQLEKRDIYEEVKRDIAAADSNTDKECYSIRI